MIIAESSFGTEDVDLDTKKNWMASSAKSQSAKRLLVGLIGKP